MAQNTDALLRDPDRIVVVDSSTCRVYSIPRAAVLADVNSTMRVPVHELQSACTGQKFTIDNMFLRQSNPAVVETPTRYTPNHIGVLRVGKENVWMSRMGVVVHWMHWMSDRVWNEKESKYDEERDEVEIASELHWVWTPRFAYTAWARRRAAARQCQCSTCAAKYSTHIDAYPLGMGNDSMCDGPGLLSIPGARLVSQSALSVGCRLVLQMILEDTPGCEERTPDVRRLRMPLVERDLFAKQAPLGYFTGSWRQQQFNAIDTSAVSVSDRLVAWCRLHGVPPIEGAKLLLARTRQWRNPGANTDGDGDDDEFTLAWAPLLRKQIDTLWKKHPKHFPNPTLLVPGSELPVQVHFEREVRTKANTNTNGKTSGSGSGSGKLARASVDAAGGSPLGELPTELWQRVFAFATMDAMHTEAPWAAARDLKALHLTCRTARAMVAEVVHKTLLECYAACERTLETGSKVARTAKDSVTDATDTGTLLRNLGLPMATLYMEHSGELVKAHPDFALTWYLSWRRQTHRAERDKVQRESKAGSAVVRDDPHTAHSRLRWRAVCTGSKMRHALERRVLEAY